MWHQKFLDLWTGRSGWLNTSPKPEHITAFILYKAILIDSNILRQNMKIYTLKFNVNIYKRWSESFIETVLCLLIKHDFFMLMCMLIYCSNYIHATVFFSWFASNGTWGTMPDDFVIFIHTIENVLSAYILYSLIVPFVWRRFPWQRHWRICEEYQFNAVYLWIRLNLQGHKTMGERVWQHIWQETFFFLFLEFGGILCWQINLFLKINHSHILFLFFVLVLSFWLCNTTDTQYILIFRRHSTIIKPRHLKKRSQLGSISKHN